MTPRDPIPFQPEPLEQLQARYAQAIEKVWEPSFGMMDTPGQHRENVFDCEDGIRIIISRDKKLFELNTDSDTVIHFSGSVNESIYTGRLDESALRKMEQHYFEISQYRGAIMLIMFSPEKKIPHWVQIKK